MTKWYKIISRTYIIILGLLTVLFLIVTARFGSDENNYNAELWFVPYSILTLTAITAFHSLDNASKFKTALHFLVCILVLLSLGFLAFIIFSAFKNEDSNLLISSILTISTFINSAFLFYLIQDKKYNHNG